MSKVLLDAVFNELMNNDSVNEAAKVKALRERILDVIQTRGKNDPQALVDGIKESTIYSHIKNAKTESDVLYAMKTFLKGIEKMSLDGSTLSAPKNQTNKHLVNEKVRGLLLDYFGVEMLSTQDTDAVVKSATQSALKNAQDAGDIGRAMDLMNGKINSNEVDHAVDNKRAQTLIFQIENREKFLKEPDLKALKASQKSKGPEEEGTELTDVSTWARNKK